MSVPAPIPVISLAPLLAGGDSGLRSVAAAIRRAATEVGFFYIADHGIDPALIAATHAIAKRFFALPLAEKRGVEINSRHRGFLKIGGAVMHGAKRPDLKESFIFGLDLPEEDPDVRAGKRLMGPNIWPPALPEMKPLLDAYYAAVVGCGEQLLRALAVALDKPEDFFRDKFRKPLARGSIIYYPPQPPDSGPEQFGVSPHSDYGCLTLLWQDDNGGLQVRGKDGGWIEAPPIPGTLIINIGDLLARWTNDLFASTGHRVINRSGRERYSIALFYDPHFDTPIEVLDTCCVPGAAPRYAPTSCGAYILERFGGAFGYRQQDSAPARK
jgi:isopenicillin N synthase-like dioxygenase